MKTAPRLAGLFAAFVLSLFALAAHAQRAASDEPTLAQIYQAANTGQLERADAMIDQVLKSHPDSARAHYVKAELAARGHKFDVARQELGTAERIAPGLPFVKPESVQALRNQLSGSRTGSTSAPAGPSTTQMGFGSGNAPAQRGLPWGTIALVAVIAIAAIAFMRRRRTPAAGDGYGGAYGSSSAAPYGQTGYGPVYPPNAGNVPPSPSMGSSIMRGLGAGLAVGAGAVAAEEIGHRMFSHDSRAATGSAVNDNPPSLDAIDEGMRRNLNTDMGGDNFGIGDGGWDDAGSGDLGGGGDWDT